MKTNNNFKKVWIKLKYNKLNRMMKIKKFKKNQKNN